MRKPVVLKLKNCRTCGGCWAYDDSAGNKFSANCVLGFKVEQLPPGNRPSARMGGGDYWTFICKPAEPCLKPLTSREYVAAMNFKIAQNKENSKLPTS